MINRVAQRTMSQRIGATVTETPGSHAVCVSNPAVVAGPIAQAARSAVPEGALACAPPLMPGAAAVWRRPVLRRASLRLVMRGVFRFRRDARVRPVVRTAGTPTGQR